MAVLECSTGGCDKTNNSRANTNNGHLATPATWSSQGNIGQGGHQPACNAAILLGVVHEEANLKSLDVSVIMIVISDFSGDIVFDKINKYL